MDTAVQPRRWWKRLPVRLSVRTLMILTLILGSGLGWVVHNARVQRDAVAAIERTGGRVRYDWEVLPNGGLNANGKPGWPKWVVERLGVDYFGHVVAVVLGKKATDTEMAAVAQFDRLRIFDDGKSTGVTDAGLATLRELTSLEVLRISGDSHVSGACLAHVRGLPNLRFVQLYRVRLADSDLVHLEGLTNLKNLHLTSAMGLTDQGLVHLKGLTGLSILGLGFTRVSDAGLAHLQSLASLTNLGLMGTDVSDAGLPVIAKLPTLETLDLSQTKVTDAGLASLVESRSLVNLRVRKSGVTLEGTKALQQAMPKVKIAP